MVIKSLKNNKAVGEDRICGELLKLGGPRLTDELFNLISRIWHKEEIPIEWRTSIICPILKKGDPKCVENYRGISLLDMGYKVLATFLLKRIQDISERVIGEYQCGFRKGTINHIFTLQQILSKHYEYNKDIHLVFIDFKQAYGNIIRNKLWNNLTKLGIPTKIVKLIKLCNNNTNCVVRMQGELSEPFEVMKGLRQGDALSPVLFNLALESVIRRTSQRQLMEVNGNYTLLAYVDDIIILSDTKQDIVNGMSNLMKECKHMGLFKKIKKKSNICT
jgi:hypothetical protein